jgi:DNA-directed RNA polymerase specialized sigma24 family protein
MTRAPKEETAEMLALRKSGLTYRQIADRYGLHFNTVHRRLGLKPTRRTPYRRPGEPGYCT